MDARDPTFPFYVVRDAAEGGGVVSMHWSRPLAEKKVAKLATGERHMIAHICTQAEYRRLPERVMCTSGPSRRRKQ